ncbi:MAG: GerMN domain-containing protein [Patescibacteria group bacterium UBA2103]
MMKTLYVLIAGVVLFFGFNYFIYHQKQADDIRVALYFPLENENLEPIQAPVLRSLPKDTEHVEEKTLTLLLEGPKSQEVGYFSPFIHENELSLIETYEKLEIEEGRAVLYFRKPALTYLNAPAFEQLLIKESIEKTMLQFESINSIEYAIDGEIFDMWDA